MSFEDLFEKALVNVFIIQNGKLIYINPCFQALLGYNGEELSDSGKALSILMNGEVNKFQDHLEALLNGQIEAIHDEFRLFTSQGNAIQAKIYSSVITIKKERAVLNILQDITEENKAATLLLHEKYLSDTLINGLPGIFYVADKEGRLQRWNKNLEMVTGCSAAELFQKQTTDFLNEQDKKFVIRKRQLSFITGKESGEVTIITKHNQKLIYFITIQPITYNEQLCVLGIGLDFTEKKKTERELLKKNWEINERVKELRSLYKISQLIKDNHHPIEWILQECVQLIPSAYQYPEITCARIILGNQDFRSEGFKQTEWKQEADIFLKGEKKGSISVFYTKKRPQMSEGPFLEEERALITTISEILGNAIETNTAHKEIIKLSRLRQFTSAINEMTLRTKNRQELFSEACRIAVNEGKFRMAWIGTYNARENTVIPFSSAGNDSGYLNNMTIYLNNDVAPGPIKRSLTTQTFYYCNDIANDPIFLPWKTKALAQGFRSSIYLPIIVNKQVEGIYVLYMPEPFFFNESEVKMLREVKENIAFALDKLRLEALQIQAEKELRESEEKFRKLVEETPVGVFIMQGEHFIYVNPQLERLLGYSRDQLINRINLEQLIHNDDLDQFSAVFLQTIKGGVTAETHQFRATRSDGATLFLEFIASPISFQGQTAIIGSIVDVTRQAEEQNRISLAVTEAQEKERLEIGMELHDNIKQIMTASMLNIDFISMNLKDEALVNEIVVKVKGFIRDAINEIRRISHQLTPGVDATLSLEDRINTLAGIMNVDKKLHVTYRYKGLKNGIDSKVQLALYRILQEQLSNVLKHAHATTLQISVQRTGDRLSMSVKDNGVGFDMTAKKQGIGLENIKRRVQLLNGSVKIDTAPGKGFDLVVQLPLK